VRCCAEPLAHVPCPAPACALVLQLSTAVRGAPQRLVGTSARRSAARNSAQEFCDRRRMRIFLCAVEEFRGVDLPVWTDAVFPVPYQRNFFFVRKIFPHHLQFNILVRLFLVLDYH
jgi:hypothetical protein